MSQNETINKRCKITLIADKELLNLHGTLIGY